MMSIEALGTTQELPLPAPLQALPPDCLFLADGKVIRPFAATRDNIERVTNFIRTFPLSMERMMSDDEIVNFILDPRTILLGSDNATVMLQGVEPGRVAHIGFVFWDRKVSGNERFLREVLKWCMKTFQIHKMSCKVVKKNRVMWRILERIGFKQEGNMREAFVLPNGVYDDVYLYGILADEMGIVRT